MVQGLLLVNKPIGISSFKVVSIVRGIIKANTKQKIKVGHSGTLDPLASGLLVIAVGPYTKRLTALTELQKTYIAEAVLGKNSTTGDSEGQIKVVSSKRPTRESVGLALASFKGVSLQTPPVFSAVKVDGIRAYKLARQGLRPSIKPRQINIKEIEIVSYKYPCLKIKTTVSSGTYIRVLVEDIGKELGTGAYIKHLVRTRVGNFDLDKAVELSQLNYPILLNNLITLENWVKYCYNP